jgi:hypothetical protein
VEERKQPRETAVNKNRRQREITYLRRKLRRLTKRYITTDEEDRPALAKMRNTIRDTLKILRRTERSRRRKKKQARARFTTNPFQYTLKLLGSKGLETLKASKEVEQHLKDMYSDPMRNEDLGGSM